MNSILIEYFGELYISQFLPARRNIFSLETQSQIELE